MTEKYELTNETVEFRGRTLFRIRALRDFGDVRKGDLGGFVECDYNLSHNDKCWIYDDAKVYDYGIVFDDAMVFGHAVVSDYAEVFECAVVSDYAEVSGYSATCGNIKISGSSKWSLDREDNPEDQFFKSSLEIKDLAIETKDDSIREFPEWLV